MPQVIGRSKEGSPVTADDLGVSGALCVLMKVCGENGDGFRAGRFGRQCISKQRFD